MNKNLKYLSESAIIAAVYIVLTLIFQPISFGQLQFRIAEALTILPALTPAGIPGIFIGCLLANLLGGGHWIDIVFGSLASLLAAWLTRVLAKRLRLDENSTEKYSRKELFRTPKLYLFPLPTIIINSLVVGFYIPIIYPAGDATLAVFLFSMLTVGLGQVIITYLLGLPLYIATREFFVNRGIINYEKR